MSSAILSPVVLGIKVIAIAKQEKTATYAGVVEWYTRATQNRMAQALWVQVPSPAQVNEMNAVTEMTQLFVRKALRGLEARLRLIMSDNEIINPIGVLNWYSSSPISGTSK